MHRNGLDLTKKSYKNDILLILVFLIIALAALAFMRFHGKSGAEVRVSVDNREYGVYSLNRDQTISIGENDWKNILEIKNGSANMTKADCPDKVCVNHAPISKKGETIVCLPHKVVVEVIDGAGTRSKDQIDIISK